MKIIDVQSIGVNLGAGNHVFAKVISDEHIRGIGEAYRVGPDTATLAVLETPQRSLDRRRFLGSIAAFAALTGSTRSAPPDQPPLVIDCHAHVYVVSVRIAHPPPMPPLVIDCHAHVYGEDEKAYPTIEKPYRPPPGKGTVPHLLRTLRENGVSRATAIQTGTFYKWDNRFLADTSKRHADVLAGVCTLDPDDPTSPATLAADFAASPGRRSWIGPDNLSEHAVESLPSIVHGGHMSLIIPLIQLGCSQESTINRDHRCELFRSTV